MGALWEEADKQNQVQIRVPSAKTAFNLRMELYRYRRALEQQANESYYRDLAVSVDQTAEGEWRVTLLRRAPLVVEPYSG
jgi:hypothetical protein